MEIRNAMQMRRTMQISGSLLALEACRNAEPD